MDEALQEDEWMDEGGDGREKECSDTNVKSWIMWIHPLFLFFPPTRLFTVFPFPSYSARSSFILQSASFFSFPPPDFISFISLPGETLKSLSILLSRQ